MTSELLQRVKIEGKDSRPSPLITNPELYCHVRDEITRYVRGELKENPGRTGITFTFWRVTPLALERIFEYAYGGEVFWPRQFEISLVRADGTVTVKYDDWSTNSSDVIAYHAKLLSPTAS